MYYIIEVETSQFIKQPNATYKEKSMGSICEKRTKTREQIIEVLKEMLVNDIFLTRNSGYFNKVVLFPRNKPGCIIETKYFISYMVSMRVDRVYVRLNRSNNPITRNSKEGTVGISESDYKAICKELKRFAKPLAIKGDEQFVLCS
jgi:hypothetical protein